MAAGAATAVLLSKKLDNSPRLGKHQKITNKHKGVKDEIDIMKIFYQYDGDKNGVLDMDELRCFLSDLAYGKKPSHNELDFILTVCDHNKNGVIDADEVLKVVDIWNTYLSCSKNLDRVCQESMSRELEKESGSSRQKKRDKRHDKKERKKDGNEDLKVRNRHDLVRPHGIDDWLGLKKDGLKKDGADKKSKKRRARDNIMDPHDTTEYEESLSLDKAYHKQFEHKRSEKKEKTTTRGDEERDEEHDRDNSVTRDASHLKDKRRNSKGEHTSPVNGSVGGSDKGGCEKLAVWNSSGISSTTTAGTAASWDTLNKSGKSDSSRNSGLQSNQSGSRSHSTSGHSRSHSTSGHRSGRGNRSNKGNEHNSTKEGDQNKAKKDEKRDKKRKSTRHRSKVYAMDENDNESVDENRADNLNAVHQNGSNDDNDYDDMRHHSSRHRSRRSSNSRHSHEEKKRRHSHHFHDAIVDGKHEQRDFYHSEQRNHSGKDRERRHSEHSYEDRERRHSHGSHSSYSTETTESLDFDGLKYFLTKLNNGVVVPDTTVRKIFDEADVLKDGKISKMELLGGISAWYNLQKKERGVRSITTKIRRGLSVALGGGNAFGLGGAGNGKKNGKRKTNYFFTRLYYRTFCCYTASQVEDHIQSLEAPRRKISLTRGMIKQ